jgi:hypothetical protein
MPKPLVALGLGRISSEKQGLCHLIFREHNDRSDGWRRWRRAMPACFASILLLGGCDVADPLVESRPPEVSLENVQFRAWRGADLAASGAAARTVYRRDPGTVVASAARVTVPRPGMPDLAVSAPELVGDLGARAWSARGGVVLTRGDATARTPTARWAESDGIVRGDEPVELTGPGYRLAGPAFTADPRTGDVEIRGGVRLVARGARP